MLNDALVIYRKRFPSIKPRNDLCPPEILEVLINNVPDVHNVPIAQVFFMAGAAEFGDCITATEQPNGKQLSLLLLTYHEWYEALDRRGLSLDERTLRINRLSFLILHMFGNSLFKAGPFPEKIFGTTYQQMTSILLIEQARLFLLERLPSDEEKFLFCSQSMMTDKCENFFAELVRLCGGKPPFHRVDEARDKLRFLMQENLKTFSERGYELPDRPDAHYPFNDLNLGGRAARLPFNDPRSYSERRNSNLIKMAFRKTSKARTTVRQHTNKSNQDMKD